MEFSDPCLILENVSITYEILFDTAYIKTVTLKLMTENTGLAKEELIQETNRRARYIEDLVQDRIFEYDEVAKRLFEHHRILRTSRNN